MKRTTALLVLLLVLSCLSGCGKEPAGALTTEAIRALAAEKGEALTWSDFASYPSVETGSGLYIRVYEIDGGYQLWIGGLPDEPPMYIRLVRGEDLDHGVDVRFEDVDAFLQQTETTLPH